MIEVDNNPICFICGIKLTYNSVWYTCSQCRNIVALSTTLCPACLSPFYVHGSFKIICSNPNCNLIKVISITGCRKKFAIYYHNVYIANVDMRNGKVILNREINIANGFEVSLATEKFLRELSRIHLFNPNV